MTKETKKITLGGVLSWIFGIIFILAAFGNFLSSSFIAGIILLIMAVAVLPTSNKFFKEKLNFELSRGIKIAIVIIGFIVIAIYAKTYTTNKIYSTSTNIQTDKKTYISLVSKSFDDFAILCDSGATNLQKRDVFDKKFKDNYVEWTGEITSISESFSQYVLQVKHCPLTFTSDIIITMKKDQKDILLNFRKGDTVTYRAKLIRIGDILGMSATEGEIIK